MRFPRSCGTLLHPTSFPSSYGMGDLGHEAKQFIDFLHQTGQTIWQVLPLGPTGYGYSPYASYSAFAGNHYLISLDLLYEQGYLEAGDLRAATMPVTVKADYESSYRMKDALYKKAHRAFLADGGEESEGFQTFKKENKNWLPTYALFMACADANGRKPWNLWDRGLARREKASLEEARIEFAPEIARYEWFQYEFYRQWYELKAYANGKGIRVVGDIPIFVDHNSADVWGNPYLFEVDSDGNRLWVAGVPPDYFSATGQLWGNPLYKWEAMKKEGFRWWIERFEQMFDLYDSIRVDHFRGFDAYWSVAASEKTAEKGEWLKAPGRALFEAIKKELGELPIIAEDLGVMTPEVEDLRDSFGFPGMKILQFAFDSDATNDFLPHNYSRNSVVYTGTHDNDTTIGWYRQAPEAQRHRMREYVRSDGHEVQWDLIRLGMLSVSDQAIFPLQDFMNLDASHRMNIPGTVGGNWIWRYTPEMFQAVDRGRIRYLAEMGNRVPSREPGRVS